MAKQRRSVINTYKRKWEAWYLKERPVIGRTNQTRPPDPPKTLNGTQAAVIRRRIARKHAPKVG